MTNLLFCDLKLKANACIRLYPILKNNLIIYLQLLKSLYVKRIFWL